MLWVKKYHFYNRLYNEILDHVYKSSKIRMWKETKKIIYWSFKEKEGTWEIKMLPLENFQGIINKK